MIKTRFGKSIKYFRSKFGGEYMSIKFHQLLSSEGIIHQTTCPHAPEQNSVSEQ